MLLWSALGLAVVGGGGFFALLTWRFNQKHPSAERPAPVGEHRATGG